ncbi:MAG TPA: DNA polymerase III subunit gamma/tau [Candidatus Acidoferrales bacterium]|nr:DNA polymerase III subunit gamma/tau [Candidatus Acidoferrales bacterium]
MRTPETHPMYQVIARKYRPQSFDDVVNQEHVKTTLENAIAQNRIAHGYIFSGQRGTGKTTIARILARCLNCVEGPTTKPCGVCASCREITSGGSVDVIEIDAASNRGIDNMRELRENVRYQPARDRYKIFIVDEAHQITNEAFNALLKTIEEPPPWAVFVLCTTEAHKIPATIASRCQHFSFRSVDFEDLTARMAWICQQEGIAADAETLAVLAAAGEGSVRDSLSALDQAIACCGAKLKAAEVRALLGAFSLESLEKVSDALAENDSRRMLEVVDELERNGQNLQHFSRELARYFRNLLVARIAGADTRLVAASAAQREKLAATAARFSEEDLTRYLQLSLDLFGDLQTSLQPRFHLEIGLVRLVQAGRLLPLEQALAELTSGAAGTTRDRGPQPAQPPPVRSAPPAIRSAPPPPPPQRTGPSPFELDRARKAANRPPEPQSSGANALAPEPAPQTATQTMAVGDARARLLAQLTVKGHSHLADAVENAGIAVTGADLQIVAPKSYALYFDDGNFTAAVREVFGRPLRVKFSAAEASVPQPTAPAHSTAPSAALAPQPAAQPTAGTGDDEVTGRALGNPEVQRFREVFGGEVRKVRNLKE